jgi:hypothetical protein
MENGIVGMALLTALLCAVVRGAAAAEPWRPRRLLNVIRRRLPQEPLCLLPTRLRDDPRRSPPGTAPCHRGEGGKSSTRGTASMIGAGGRIGTTRLPLHASNSF